MYNIVKLSRNLNTSGLKFNTIVKMGRGTKNLLYTSELNINKNGVLNKFKNKPIINEKEDHI